MNEPDDAGAFKARIINLNRDAFELYRNTAGEIEEAIPKARDISEPFARALDVLFLQAYKSFAALYLLGVHGHGEDAATILRRLLEIFFQAGHLTKDPAERTLRGEQYLAYYWARIPELLRRSVDSHARSRGERLYEEHRHLLRFDQKGRPKNWWGGSIRDLAEGLGFSETYDRDYRFLSQMAHGTSQGILVDIGDGRIDIRSDQMVREIWVYGCQYMIKVAWRWNDHFNLIEGEKLVALHDRVVKFDLKRSPTS